MRRPTARARVGFRPKVPAQREARASLCLILGRPAARPTAIPGRIGSWAAAPNRMAGPGIRP